MKKIDCNQSLGQNALTFWELRQMSFQMRPEVPCAKPGKSDYRAILRNSIYIYVGVLFSQYILLILKKDTFRTNFK